MNIHPTAVVHPQARLHESVRVDAHAVIDADTEIGAGCYIGSGVRIYSGVRMGTGNEIYANAVLGTLPQDLGFDPATATGVVIGDSNRIREGVNISRSTKPERPTRIGNRNYLMGNFHIGHDSQIGDRNILTHGSVLAGHVTVGNGVVISGLVAVHQFCRIGDLAMLSGCSRVNKDVPPYCMAEGNPTTIVGLNVVGMRRGGAGREIRLAVKRAYETLFRSGTRLADAIAELKALPACAETDLILEFVAASKRGLTRHRRDFSADEVVTDD